MPREQPEKVRVLLGQATDFAPWTTLIHGVDSFSDVLSALKVLTVITRMLSAPAVLLRQSLVLALSQRDTEFFISWSRKVGLSGTTTAMKWCWVGRQNVN
jgi:hypothetical protein